MIMTVIMMMSLENLESAVLSFGYVRIFFSFFQHVKTELCNSFIAYGHIVLLINKTTIYTYDS